MPLTINFFFFSTDVIVSIWNLKEQAMTSVADAHTHKPCSERLCSDENLSQEVMCYDHPRTSFEIQWMPLFIEVPVCSFFFLIFQTSESNFRFIASLLLKTAHTYFAFKCDFNLFCINIASNTRYLGRASFPVPSNQKIKRNKNKNKGKRTPRQVWHDPLKRIVTFSVDE